MYFPHNGGACEDKEITFQRTEACSSCHPGKCWKEGAPEWGGYESLCGGAPFDPEGLLSSVTCVVASLFGLQAGRAVFEFPGKHAERLEHWTWLSLWSIAVGLALHLMHIIPFNTDLYSPSFLLITNGTSVAVLTLCYYVSDVRGIRVFEPFRWLGMNSIAIYLLACSDIVASVLGCFYWGNRDASLANILFPTGVYWGPKHLGDWQPPANKEKALQGQVPVMLWVCLAYIPTWIFVAWVMHRRRYYFKV